MKLIEILQNQIIMFCIEKKLSNITRIPALPEFESEQDTIRNLQRCEKLKNSIPLYYEKQESEKLVKEIDYHVEIFEQFVRKVYAKELNAFVEAVNLNDYSDFGAWINYFKQAQEAVDWILTLENTVKQYCVKDWNKYLLDSEEFYIKQEWKEYAFILQAVESFNPLRNLKGPAVSSSLYTNELPYTYKNRFAGIVYRLTPKNFISMATSDSSSHVEHLIGDREKLLSVLKWSCIENTYNLIFLEDWDSCYYPFHIFIKKCIERVKIIQNRRENYNEILLLPNFENDIIGIFYQWDAPEGLRQQAIEFSKMSHRKLLVQEEDGTLRLQ